MQWEYKALPQFVKQVDGRSVTGIFAVHGNIDDYGDRSHPGTFADYRANGRSRVRFLWQHNAMEPPIASITAIRELSRDQLPAQVLSYAPDATGAAEVTREYLDTARGSEVLEGIKAGAITEMSYAFTVDRYDYQADDENVGQEVRNLYGVTLYDISDVLWGANPATLAGSKRMPLAAEHEAVRATVDRYTQRLQDLTALRAKEGRVLSDANRKRIQEAVATLEQSIKALQDLLQATEPGDPDKAARQAEGQRLYAAYQHTLARLQGVR